MTSDPTDREPGPPSGWRIGRYRVDAVLGTGAFATVYRAVDERLDDTVAVKVLAENHSLDPEIRKRFLTEGRVLRRIDSPHVVDVHDLGETERQQPFLVLEYASRGTLSQRVHDLRTAGWRPAPADLWAVAEPLAQALDAVHRAGVVHRDVNPTNVLLTTRGVAGQPPPATVVRADERVVLADLGLCKDLALHSGHTSAGGTEGFRPPELRGGPAIIDGRADLWSLSALLTWLATGSPPDGTPVGTAISGAGLPTDLARVLHRSLAEDPRTRHPDAPTWLSDIRSALAGPGLGTLTGGNPYAGALDAWSGSATWTPPSGGGSYAGTTPGVSGAGPVPVPWSAPPSGGETYGDRGAVRGPVPPPADPASRGWWWRLRHSAWVLASLPLGLTTWAGFLYVGARARHTRWLWAAGAYALSAVLVVGLMASAPVDDEGLAALDAWQTNVASAGWLFLWPTGIVHALLANRQWLRWRASSG